MRRTQRAGRGIGLLLAMGYGGSRQEAGEVTQRSNDEGIDGLINEDRLGLDRIYIQAHSYQIKRVDSDYFDDSDL